MGAFIEKRTHNRYQEEGSIQWGFFKSYAYSQGKTVDTSEGGLSFRSPSFLKPGTTLIIKGENGKRRFPEFWPWLKVAEVKWCEEAAEADHPYLVGVRYYGPHYS